MTKPNEKWGPGKPIDCPGLEIVESKMQGLGAAIDFVLRYADVPWRFLLLVVEYGGGGSCYIRSPASDRGEMVRVARAGGKGLREKGSRWPAWSVRDVEAGAAASAGPLSGESLVKLAASVKPLGEAIERELPKGWGCALLLYDPGDNGYLYVSSAEREDMATALLESADRWERHEDRPPGRLGKDA